MNNFLKAKFEFAPQKQAMELTRYGKHGKPKSRLSTLVCCDLKRNDRFTFRWRGRSHPRPALAEPDGEDRPPPLFLYAVENRRPLSLHVQGRREEQAR